MDNILAGMGNGLAILVPVGLTVFSALMGYVAMFVLFQIGKVRTEILLEMKDLEARVMRAVHGRNERA